MGGVRGERVADKRLDCEPFLQACVDLRLRARYAFERGHNAVAQTNYLCESEPFGSGLLRDDLHFQEGDDQYHDADEQDAEDFEVRNLHEMTAVAIPEVFRDKSMDSSGEEVERL